MIMVIVRKKFMKLEIGQLETKTESHTMTAGEVQDTREKWDMITKTRSVKLKIQMASGQTASGEVKSTMR